VHPRFPCRDAPLQQGTSAAGSVPSVRSRAVALHALMLATARQSWLSVSPSHEHKPEGRDREPRTMVRCSRRRGAATDKFVMRSARHRVILSLRAVVLPLKPVRGPGAIHLLPPNGAATPCHRLQSFMLSRSSRVLLRTARLPVPAARASPDPRSPHLAQATEGRGLGAEPRAPSPPSARLGGVSELSVG
jgi:hypothetical protein